MRKILLFTYAGIFLACSLPLLLILYLIGIFNLSLRNRLAYKTAQWFAGSILYFLSPDIHVTGLENVPEERAVLFVGNHKSLIDVLLVLHYTPRVSGFIAKDSLGKVPLLSWWMSAFQCLFLDRNSARNALNTILKGIDNMKNGHCYIIFPEGTRNIGSDELLPFKKGSLKLAEKSDSLIVPFALRGTDTMYEQNNNQVKVGPLWLSFGQPIDLKTLSAEELKTSNIYVQIKVKELYDATFDINAQESF
ncbi:1-acyl-sn-glycerol-3-phosphate acyltransferase [Clostridiales bacterium COT073_COT-073]|nr:1-acyl-sn-glycerol-3-phosphate acyltransferase [Clostridiales bacterium COT073_COT-073]